MFTLLENLDNDMDITRAWETVRENITISSEGNSSYYELKQQNSSFKEGHSNEFDQRKRAKMQWL
jgi:fructose-1-phosphate kinase PfkB-like protein